MVSTTGVWSIRVRLLRDLDRGRQRSRLTRFGRFAAGPNAVASRTLLSAELSCDFGYIYTIHTISANSARSVRSLRRTPLGPDRRRYPNSVRICDGDARRQCDCGEQSDRMNGMHHEEKASANGQISEAMLSWPLETQSGYLKPTCLKGEFLPHLHPGKILSSPPLRWSSGPPAAPTVPSVCFKQNRGPEHCRSLGRCVAFETM